MKKIGLIFIMTFCTLFYAISQEHRILIGGSVGFQTSKIESDNVDTKQNNIIISPTIGTMINEKVAIGLQLSYISQYVNSEAEYGGTYKINQNQFSISPFIRIHHRITDNLNFFTEPFISKTFLLEDKSDNKTQIYNAGITWGLLYFITQKMSLELNLAGLNYRYMGDKDEDLRHNTLNFVSDLSDLNIGLKYYF